MGLFAPVLQPVLQPPLVPLRDFSPAHRFRNGEQGAIYEVSPQYIYEDAAGTTPASLNGPAGHVRDLSPNGNHLAQATAAAKPLLRGTPTGADLLTNGALADGTGWTTSGSVTFTVGTAVIDDVAGVDAYIAQQLSGLAVGQVYQIEVKTTANTTATAAGFTVAQGAAANGAEYSTSDQPQLGFIGIWRFHITAGAAAPWLTLRTSELDKSVTVDSITVKLAHAYPDVQAPYWLETDGVDDCMRSALEFTLQNCRAMWPLRSTSGSS